MKKARIISLLLALCFLISCTQQPPSSSSSPTSSAVSSGVTSSGETSSTPPPAGSSSASSAVSSGASSSEIQQTPVEQFVFTRENFPRLNGSTSTVPLGKAMASVLLGETQEEVSDLISFSKTTKSYRQLMYGYADLLIAAEPAATIWELKESKGFAWEMEPFAVDGLVFLVNESNPVDSLTTEQVQKIYTGEITNWAQVGGDDLDIVPFQRNPEAGSQTAMLKLVMGDLPMMDAPAEYLQGEMGDLIEAVAAYDGTAAAIGYTVYYYAEDMRMADGLKILAIDGVTPCDETIRSGEYPFLNNYYTLIAAGLPEDAPAKVMYDWLLSEDGQRLVAQQGYVSVLDVPGVPPTAEEAARSPVVSHWDVFKETEITPLYSWYEPRSADGLLQPRDDYGTLLKYVGTVSTQERYNLDRLPLYGLVTTDGRVVTEPVYASVSFYGDSFLILMQGEATGYRETEWGKEPIGGFRYTVAAADGSWVRDVGRIDTFLSLDGGRLLIALHDRSILILNADGSTAAEYPPEALTPVLGEHYRINWEAELWIDVQDGIPTISRYDHEKDEIVPICWLDIASGTILTKAPTGWSPDLPPPAVEEPQPPRAPDYGYLDPVTDPITGTTYFYGFNREFKRYDLLCADGTIAFAGCNLYSVGAYENCILRAGLLATADDNFFCYHDLESWEVVFRWPIRSNSD